MPKITDLEQQAAEMQRLREAGQPTGGYVRGTIENGKFFIEDDAGKREVSAEEYAQQRQAPRRMYNEPMPGLEKPRRMSAEDRRKAALSELDGMKKGGAPKKPKKLSKSRW